MKKLNPSVSRFALTGLLFSCVFVNLVVNSIFLSSLAAESPQAAEGDSKIAENKLASLYRLMHDLTFPGWNVTKAGLFVQEGGKYIQVLSSAYQAKLTGAKTVDKYLRSSSFAPGKEGILAECGCQAVAQKVFRRGNRFVTFEGFQFDSAIGANAGYNFLRSGSTTVLRRGDGSSEDGQSISYWQDRYFFRIFTSEYDDSEAKELVSEIANRIGKVVVSHSRPMTVLRSLPTMARVKGSEKIVRGPLSASHYLTIPYIKQLGIERAKEALVADYQVYEPHRERLKVLYIDYGDPVLAQRAYVNFATNISQLQPPVNGGPDSSPRSLFRINKRFLMCELKTRGRVIVISGARKKQSCGALSSQI